MKSDLPRRLIRFFLVLFFLLASSLWIFATAETIPQLIQADVIKIVVIITEAEVRWHPDLSSIVIKTIPKGTVLESKERIGDWYEVVIPPNELGIILGYIHSNAVEPVIEKREEEKSITLQDKQKPQQEKQVPRSPPASPSIAKEGNFFIEIKGTYFLPSKTVFKDTYKNRWMGEGEFTARVFKFIELWLGGNYYRGNGKLPFSDEDTSMTLIGLVGGLKFKAAIGAFRPYLGIGPLVYFYKERNPIGTAKGNKIGFIGQAGINFFFSKSLFLDCSLSYTRCEVQPQRVKTDLGGLYGGIGLGFAF